jgi:hypothetical protein
MLSIEKIEKIAEACHEALRHLDETSGKSNKKAWADTEEWRRETTVNGVIDLIADPATMPKQVHDNWMRRKIKEGWVYGETFDEAAKVNPCLVEYEELPMVEKLKDMLFRITVVAHCSVLGIMIPDPVTARSKRRMTG